MHGPDLGLIPNIPYDPRSLGVAKKNNNKQTQRRKRIEPRLEILVAGTVGFVLTH